MSHVSYVTKRALDVDTMYNELVNATESTAILAENAVRQYGEKELAGQLAQQTLELIDRIDELYNWVAQGGPLPGQVKEVTSSIPVYAHILENVIAEMIENGF